MNVELTACPECDGLGMIDGHECGVCCGDRFIWPDDGSKPGWLHDRFKDHSHHAHRCTFCTVLPDDVAEVTLTVESPRASAHADAIAKDLQVLAGQHRDWQAALHDPDRDDLTVATLRSLFDCSAEILAKRLDGFVSEVSS